MKKVFPLIVGLITLSLLGIILIQNNWIQNAAIIKREQLKESLVEATDEIGTRMVERKVPLGRLNIQRSVLGNDPAMKVLADQMSLDMLNRTIPVSSKFSSSEVNELVKKVFKEKGLSSSYEFGIIPNYSLVPAYILRSPGIMQATQDTLNNLQCLYPLSNEEGFFPTGETLIITIPISKEIIFRSLGWMIAGSILFTFIIVAAFALTIFTMLRQKKVSEIKSDFINNMTHELKTPLATISLAVDAIGNEKVTGNQEKVKYFTGIIREENKRMNRQVESILQSALLEKREIKLTLQTIDIHKMIHRILDHFQLQFENSGVCVNLALNATQTLLQADEIHFSNMINNLLDNSIKYSSEHIEITLSTGNTNHHSLWISVVDNGVGMSKETQARIFEKFYRAHTGNLHNVKGFGLGLAYVKAVVDAHHGSIRVESTLGKGSSFIMEFPQEPIPSNLVQG